MSLVQRAQAILLRPKETWPAIASEATDAASLYSSYILPLAAIPPIAQFIGLSLIGIGGFGVSMRMPIVSGLVHLIVSYVLSLAVIYGLALLVDALAPTFGGTRSRIEALKVVAYSSTAGFVGGIFGIIPALGILSLIASLYGIYLLYTGLPVLMQAKRDRTLGYTVVIVICTVAITVAIAIASGVLLGILTPPDVGVPGSGTARA